VIFKADLECSRTFEVLFVRLMRNFKYIVVCFKAEANLLVAFGLLLDISNILGICEHCEYCWKEFLNRIIIDLNGFCL
jgi:hypothetical protein